MDPVTRAFIIEAAIYLVGTILVFVFGYAIGRIHERFVQQLKADRAWKLSRIFRRYQTH